MNIKRELIRIAKILGLENSFILTEDYSNKKVFGIVNFVEEGMEWTRVSGKYRILGKGKSHRYGNEFHYVLENPKHKNDPIIVPVSSVIKI